MVMAGGMFTFSLVDAQAKLLTETMHPIQIVWCRQLGLFLGVLAVIAWKGLSVLRTAKPGLQIARGLCGAGSASLFIFAVAYVPLADAVAVSFVAPFVVTVLGALVLGETVGLRRWSAVAIGFLATLIIIRPGAGVVHPAAFLVILAAVLFAMRQVISRAVAGQDPVITTVCYTALVALAVLTIPLPLVWDWGISGRELRLLVTIAIMAAAAEIMVIKALELAQAVVVAPMQYSLLIWGTIWGFLFFGDLPDHWTWIGALIIVASGAYTLHRERLASR